MENELQVLYSPSFYACGCPASLYNRDELCKSCEIKDKFNLKQSPTESAKIFEVKAREKIKDTGLKLIHSNWKYSVDESSNNLQIDILLSANVHDESFYKLAKIIGEQINNEKEHIAFEYKNVPYANVFYYTGVKTKEEREAAGRQARINLEAKRKEDYRIERDRILNWQPPVKETSFYEKVISFLGL